MNIISIEEAQIRAGDEVVVRSSLDLPIVNGVILDDYRLLQSLRTINFLTSQGARVVVLGHLKNSSDSLEIIYKELKKHIDIKFINKNIGEEVFKEREKLKNGEVLLLENTRSDKREKECSGIYAEELLGKAKIFCFDDFATSHREHSSTLKIMSFAKYCYAGIRMYEEMSAMEKVTSSPLKPAIAIIGGAKCGTKIPLIKNLLTKYDKVFIGGVTANTILSQSGINVGNSLISDVVFDKDIMENEKLVLPIDVMVLRNRETLNILVSEIENEDVVVDMGERTINILRNDLENAKTLIWNGPLGFYEKGFIKQSLAISEIIKGKRIYSLVGGGDTISILSTANTLNNWTFASTGGGAMLSYISNNSLPAAQKLEEFFNKD